MNRGFPRPFMSIESKRYPMPYTAQDTAISLINSERMSECADGGLCLVCGESVGVSCEVLLKNGVLFSESGPFHGKCLTLTMKLCPHIVNNETYSRAVRETELVMSFVAPWWE